MKSQPLQDLQQGLRETKQRLRKLCELRDECVEWGQKLRSNLHRLRESLGRPAPAAWTPREIAHRINNPLSYVLANIRFVMEELENPAGDRREILRALEDVRLGAEEIERVVGDLRRGRVASKVGRRRRRS